MVQSIGAIGGHSKYNDPEYLRIIMELRQLGINPTGDKNVDKAKLVSEKQKLAQKIEEKIETKQPEDSSSMAEMRNLELQRPGAMTVADLNKILHKLV